MPADGGHEVGGAPILARYGILRERDPRHINHVAALIKRALRVPIVGIAMLPQTGLQQIAAIGLPADGLAAKEMSLTAACVGSQAPLVLPDIVSDHRFCGHPRVANPPFVRSAAAVPFRSYAGPWLGAIVIWDVVPRQFTDDEISLLEQFAITVADEVDLIRAFAEARERERVLQAIFDNAGVGILVNGMDGGRIAVNNRFCEFLGRTREEILSIPTGGLVHPDDADEGSVYHSLIASGRIAAYQREARFVTGSGKPIWLRMSVANVSGLQIGSPCTIVVAENIDDRRTSESTRAMMLAELNHRVSNSLAIVQGIAGQLLRASQSRDEFASALEGSLQHLALAHDILTDCSWRPLEIGHVISGVVARARPSDAERISYQGTAMVLNAQSTVLVALILGEYLADSAEAGALATPSAMVRIIGEERACEHTTWLHITCTEDMVEGYGPSGSSAFARSRLQASACLGTGLRRQVEQTSGGRVTRLSLPVSSSTGIFEPV